jgi:hypothetical protein
MWTGVLAEEAEGCVGDEEAAEYDDGCKALFSS